MALTQNDWQQLSHLLDQKLSDQRTAIMFDSRTLLDQELSNQRAAIMLDSRTLLDEKIQIIHAELEWIKARLTQIQRMESGDMQAMNQEIELLKKKVKKLEAVIANLQH